MACSRWSTISPEDVRHPCAQHGPHAGAHHPSQLLEHDPADQQDLEAIGQAAHEGALEAGEALQGVSEPEGGPERQETARGAVVAGAAGAARALGEALDGGQQPLEDRSRHRAVPEMLQQQLPLAVGEGDEAERDEVAVGDLGVEGIARGRLGDPLLVRPQHVTGRGILEVVLGRRLADGVAHVAQRRGQHLMAQRLIDRGQPVDAEQMDHRAQRGAVDQERDQHEAGREDRDEALDLGLDGRVLGHRERKRERHRTAQAAPQDHELVIVADALP